MPKKFTLCASLAISSAAVTVALGLCSQRVFEQNRIFGSGQEPGQRLLSALLERMHEFFLEFLYFPNSWFLAGLILLAVPVAVLLRSVTSLLVAELLGFAFGFFSILWNVGTPPGKLDLRLLHPGSAAISLAGLSAAVTLASLVLAIRFYRDDHKPLNPR
jgi:hypothetical protein